VSANVALLVDAAGIIHIATEDVESSEWATICRDESDDTVRVVEINSPEHFLLPHGMECETCHRLIPDYGVVTP
jgi:hypothetical protein